MFNVVPSVQECIVRQGDFKIFGKNRLVVLPQDEFDLVAILQRMQVELSAVLGRVLEIYVGSDPQPGDILTEISPLSPEHPQGYLVDIDSIVNIKATTPTGIFYGLQTLRQILLDNPTSLPKCTIRDFPDFEQRGIMVDAGRKYWNMSYLHDLMLQMARIKLNTLHLHFNEWNAFRLQSAQNSGLAAEKSYSKEDLAQLQAWADQYHIILIPEIDLPGHATTITHHNPDLGFDCDAMSIGRWPGGESGGWTINFIDPVARQWMKDLVSEFIPLFSGPYFHIGTDEIPDGNSASRCDQLVKYAREHGFVHAGDAFVEWINEMNAFIRSFGKQMQIWSWWDLIPHGLSPDKDIVINTWVETGASDIFLDAGYPVVHSSEKALYLTPGLNTFPNNDFLYHTWELSRHSKSLGYKICVWADNMEIQPDELFEEHLQTPRAILAERTWKSIAPTRPLADFLETVERVMSF